MKIFAAIKEWKRERRARKKILAWESKGKITPPPAQIKQRIVKRHAEQYYLKILVETGTYKGDMIKAMEKVFDRIFSIELSEELFSKAKERFRHQKHIELIHGDSGKELAKVLPKIDQPALFWLDGHYSGGKTAKGLKDTPIYEELTHIFKAKDLGHVILIDDARCFGQNPDYPSLEELAGFIKVNWNQSSISIEDDIICVICRPQP